MAMSVDWYVQQSRAGVGRLPDIVVGEYVQSNPETEAPAAVRATLQQAFPERNQWWAQKIALLLTELHLPVAEYVEVAKKHKRAQDADYGVHCMVMIKQFELPMEYTWDLLDRFMVRAGENFVIVNAARLRDAGLRVADFPDFYMAFRGCQNVHQAIQVLKSRAGPVPDRMD